MSEPHQSLTLSDPLLERPPTHVREGDFIILLFGDGRRYFAHCLRHARGKSSPLKINKRTYPTQNLIGLPYGTVLELGSSGLTALPEGEGLLPHHPMVQSVSEGTEYVAEPNSDADAEDTTFPPIRDNRHFFDTNTSQGLKFQELQQLRQSGTEGSVIVEKIIENSATFEQKTAYSRAKYIARKQMKYQQRCRIVRCTGPSICEALFLKDPKKLMNIREDTLSQILGYSNISAACQVLLFETCSGVVTGSVAQRMGGYGKILSVYLGQQPAWTDFLQKFNLSFAESSSIKWLHSRSVFGCDDDDNESESPVEEAVDRDALEWPCPLQDHTRRYMKEDLKGEKARGVFLAKRAARFARKLTRHTDCEADTWLRERQSDAVIIASRYDPTATLLKMMPFLAPSCPFVVYSEYVEPLTECFHEIQRLGTAINLRLSNTWKREYQVLPGRTHPNMNMSQSGGFLLTGVKLDPTHGRNELDEEFLKEIRAQIGGRRGKPKSKRLNPGDDTRTGDGKSEKGKRRRTDQVCKLA